ncbi:MAG TPA: hypothetical protein VFB13_06895 [Reyranella sp.]|jgi:hypothetical protein|nr:hypothetical protein [Reyranella sp.]
MLTRLTVVEGVLSVVLVIFLAGYSTAAEWYEAWLKEWGPGWHEMAWPFGRDAFPAGKAWRNDDMRVYVRPKLGFCSNCDTGVVDDYEVDRVTDIDLIDENFVPAADGSRIHITDMTGRARLYRLKGPDGKPMLAEGIAVNFNCDLVVAVVTGSKIDDPAVRKAAHEFIESNTVQVWVNKILEGR